MSIQINTYLNEVVLILKRKKITIVTYRTVTYVPIKTCKIPAGISAHAHTLLQMWGKPERRRKSMIQCFGLSNIDTSTVPTKDYIEEIDF